MSSGTTDKLKGRVKEAAGALTDDDDLKKAGKADQAIGKLTSGKISAHPVEAGLMVSLS
jgi:uncharacterized protein YjbJ (UPF0337 family)